MIFLMLSRMALASHIIGGDIYYDYLGNNQYKFYITLYRDCNSQGADYDSPLKLSVYRTLSSQLQMNVDVTFPGSVILPINFNNPCATPPNNICVQRAIYTVTLTLPPIQGGYTISYQRCCRGPNITNLVNPDDTGLTLTTQIPGSETGNHQNSSPRFVDYPPVLLCTRDQITFNHSATDPDGDQLVYSLVTPYSGASASTPAPNQAPPPPYYPVNWQSAFNAQQPLGPGSSTAISPTTGVMTVYPNMLGLFVVGVRVQEYRNGVLIGSTVRDFLFRVFDCNIILQAILPTQEQLPDFVSYCQGLTVNFTNQSYGGSNYAWDFGVPGTTTDVSTAVTPSFTYPSPGTYEARLIVNPGANCTDTAYMTVKVDVPFNLSWQAPDSLCITNNSFDFQAICSNQQANLIWTFPASASVSNTNGLNIPNVSFSNVGYQKVTVTGSSGACTNSYTDSVLVLSPPVSTFLLPNNVQCQGYTVAFQNQSQNATAYFWNFGAGNATSTNFSPSFTYNGPGTYTTSLIAMSNGGCSDTSSQTFSINEPIVLSFTHNDSLCLSGGFYNFDATVSGPPNTTYAWDFGQFASPQFAATVDVDSVTYLQGGVFPVVLTGSIPGCSVSAASQVFVFGVPEIDFEVVNKRFCAPAKVQFVNLSQTDATALYFWNFGDGTMSSITHPTHVYDLPGTYAVSLNMITLEGCADTLFKELENPIVIHPSPIAAFTIEPPNVDVCNSEVKFINQSEGAVAYYYYLERRSFLVTEPDFVHSYVTPGTDNPMLVAENQFGCKDTAIRTVMVEPISIYIPNTFVPDNDGVNDFFIPRSAYKMEEWDFRIFNKWGQELFFSNSVEQGWDGMYKGYKCQDDTYIYVLKYKSCDNPYVWKSMDGFVNLLR